MSGEDLWIEMSDKANLTSITVTAVTWLVMIKTTNCHTNARLKMIEMTNNPIP